MHYLAELDIGEGRTCTRADLQYGQYLTERGRDEGGSSIKVKCVAETGFRHGKGGGTMPEDKVKYSTLRRGAVGEAVHS